MHSKIFEVSEKPCPDDGQYTFSANDICDMMADKGTGANYVRLLDGDSDLINAVTDLMDIYPVGIDVNPVESTITITDKNLYFTETYHAFLNMVKSLFSTTLEQFIRKDLKLLGMTMYRLNEAYEGDYGYYVIDADTGILATLDNFVRAAKTGKTYYINNVYDYHFR